MTSIEEKCTDHADSDLPQAEDVLYVNYEDESLLPAIQALVAADLSEPYSVFTYRFFLNSWPNLCICVFAKLPRVGDSAVQRGEMIGTIVCKAEEDLHGGSGQLKGYIAMLTVRAEYRKKGIGKTLAVLGIQRMINLGCDEIYLETEAVNHGALKLYEKLGFMRDEKMIRYYLNGGDAFRLKLFVEANIENRNEEEEGEQAEEEIGTLGAALQSVYMAAASSTYDSAISSAPANIDGARVRGGAQKDDNWLD